MFKSQEFPQRNKYRVGQIVAASNCDIADRFTKSITVITTITCVIDDPSFKYPKYETTHGTFSENQIYGVA